MITEVKQDEKVYRWPQGAGDEPELDGQQMAMVINAHEQLPTTKKLTVREKKDLLRRCFDLGKPNIVMGPENAYCRIHHDSVKVMRVIINQYYA